MQSTKQIPVLQQEISAVHKTYKSSECALHLLLSADSISFGEFAYETKTLQSYTRYDFPIAAGITDQIEGLKWLFDNEKTLLQKYFTTSLSYFNQEVVLLPTDLNQQDQELQLSIDMNSVKKYTAIPALQARCNFMIPASIEAFFAKNQCYEITHASATLLNHLIAKQKFIRSKTIYVNFQNGWLEIIGFDQEQLLLHNIFPVKAAEDYIYFILSVYEALQFNTSSVNCVLMGDIDKPSKIYDHIFKYIHHFEFAKEPIHIKYSVAFEGQKLFQFYSFLTSIQ